MTTTAVAHPNIALIKYWGKSDPDQNLPAVGSISVTLDGLATTTSVRFDSSLDDDRFVLDGRPHDEGLPRVRRCLDFFRSLRPTLPHASVESENNFPTAAGLASSASGFAALVVAANHASGAGVDRDGLAELARRCSGSAARSLFGGFVELELIDRGRRTTTRTILDRRQWPLEVVVAITSRRPKTVGSTDGMLLTERTSPYYRAWVDTSVIDLAEARSAIANRDFQALADISEQSCLKMHAVALASRPGLLYWNPITVHCIERIRELRAQGVAVFFTVDAGPQVKAVCEPGVSSMVEAELASIPGVEETMVAGLGDGARLVEP